MSKEIQSRSHRSRRPPIEPAFSSKDMQTIAIVKKSIEDPECADLLSSIIRTFEEIRSRIATAVEENKNCKVSISIDTGNTVLRLREEISPVLNSFLQFLAKFKLFSPETKTIDLSMAKQDFRYRDGEKDEKGSYEENKRTLRKHLRYFRERLKKALEQSKKAQK